MSWQISMSVKSQTLVTKTLIVWTLMDLTHVLVDQDSPEMGLLVLVGDCFNLVVRGFILPAPKLWKRDLRRRWEDSYYVLLCNHLLESLATLTIKYDFSTFLESFRKRHQSVVQAYIHVLKSCKKRLQNVMYALHMVNLNHFHPHFNKNIVTMWPVYSYFHWNFGESTLDLLHARHT